MHPYVLADVFTDRPLEGNALAVFTEGAAVAETQLQRIARELNLSETVFVLAPEHGGHARIRIFTPNSELPFAGHPTLGTAVVLAGSSDEDEIRLETGAGVVPVQVERDGQRRPVAGRMSTPVPTWAAFERADEVLAAVGVSESLLPMEGYLNGPRHVYVALPDIDAVARLTPDQAALARLPGVGVSCFAGSGRHWTTRMFAPSLGVAEDPATGSAAGPLALHLARHGWIGWGEEITISQGERIGRPSTLLARVEGSAESVTKVEVAGRAVVVGRGELAY
jgi:trans-2,3-dihydro-3-hydroxyanthranilate isomerase